MRVGVCIAESVAVCGVEHMETRRAPQPARWLCRDVHETGSREEHMRHLGSESTLMAARDMKTATMLRLRSWLSCSDVRSSKTMGAEGFSQEISQPNASRAAQIPSALAEGICQGNFGNQTLSSTLGGREF